MSIADRMVRGESEQDARQAAVEEFGNLPLIQDTTCKEWGRAWLEWLYRNLRYALRRLRRTPQFLVATVTVIALGIAVTTTIYSVVYAVILHPLPFAQPDQLVAVSAKPLPLFDLPAIHDWEQGSHAFQSIAAYDGWSPRIESSAGVGQANAELVSQNFAKTLGIEFALGHDFTKTGNESECLGQAIVSYSYWKRMGGGDTLTNRTLQLNYKTYTIVGVLARDEDFEDMEALGAPSVLTHLECDPSKSLQSHGDETFRAIGRLYPGVSLQKAEAELKTRHQVLSREFPQYYAATAVPFLITLADSVSNTGIRTALYATLAACGLLLLIACANLINLLLARNMRRRSEFALYTILGATPRDLAGQMLLENAILSATGAMIGIALSVRMVHAVIHLSVVHLPRLAFTKVNLPVLSFAIALTVLISLLLIFLPALRSLRPSLLSDLIYGGLRGSSISFGLQRAGRFFVMTQLAMAFVLVASSGWMVSSVFILLHQPLGFAPNHLLIASIDLRGHTRDLTLPPPKVLAVLNQALTDVRGLPGVTEAAAANDKPLGGRINRYEFCTDAHPEGCNRSAYMAPDVFEVTPQYFRTIGQEIYRGRSFNESDNGHNHVAIVNRVLASEQWPEQSPIGHRIYSGKLRAWATVVGEVGNVHSYSLERKPVPNLYLPEADGPETAMTIFVRTSANLGSMSETIRRILHKDEEIELRSVESMPELMAYQVAVRRFAMWIILSFGVLALSLAILGTYALLAYEVSVREREIGIRLAMGSSRQAIVSLLIRQELPSIAIGLVFGLIGAILAGFLLKAEFYHAKAASLPVLPTALILLVIPALAAVVIPSRRASLLDQA